MAQQQVYVFAFRDVVRALCRDAGLTSGEWTMTLTATADSLNLGPTIDRTYPGVFVAVQGLTLVPAQVDTPEHLVFDAGELRGQ